MKYTFYEIANRKLWIHQAALGSVSTSESPGRCQMFPGACVTLGTQLPRSLTPRPTTQHSPATGRYSTLSAITKPTLKKMLLAGRNGTTPSATPISTQLPHCKCISAQYCTQVKVLMLISRRYKVFMYIYAKLLILINQKHCGMNKGKSMTQNHSQS